MSINVDIDILLRHRRFPTGPNSVRPNEAPAPAAPAAAATPSGSINIDLYDNEILLRHGKIPGGRPASKESSAAPPSGSINIDLYDNEILMRAKKAGRW